MPIFSWIIGLWQELINLIGKELGGIVAAAVLSVIGAIVAGVVSFIRRFIDYHKRLLRVRRDVARVPIGGWMREGKGLWRAEPILSPDIKLDPIGEPKVLVVANAKGGVGKTTVAANLAARWAEIALLSGSKPILLIDLDFQGTLSAMAMCGEKGWLPSDHKDSDATYLISGDWNSARIAEVNRPATSIGLYQNPSIAVPRIQNKLQIISAHYDLAQAENREMVEWLIGDRGEDIRFRLRRLLWSKEVISAYSAVVIDCAPRFTTAVVQALAAATHILIPTKLDRASHEAVISFAQQVEILREAGICSEAMRYAGVVGTMVEGNGNLEPLRKQLNDKLRASRANGGIDGKAEVFSSDIQIVQNVIFRDAGGRGIAYFLMGDSQQLADVKNAIKLLARRVAQEMHLPHNFVNGGLDEVKGNACVA